MEDIFSYGWSGIKKFFKDNRYAILYTVIVHLVIGIVMVFIKVDGLKNGKELGIELPVVPAPVAAAPWPALTYAGVVMPASARVSPN